MMDIFDGDNNNREKVSILHYLPTQFNSSNDGCHSNPSISIEILIDTLSSIAMQDHLNLT